MPHEVHGSRLARIPESKYRMPAATTAAAATATVG
jgi:hypothetical protein